MSPVSLHGGGNHHAEGGEEYSGAHSLEESDAAFFSGESPEEGDYDSVVDGKPECHSEHDEDVEGCSGNLEVAGSVTWQETAVGLEGLEHHESVLLNDDKVVENRRHPYWDHSY